MHKQTDRQTDRQTNRHYKNNGHLAVNQKVQDSEATCRLMVLVSVCRGATGHRALAAVLGGLWRLAEVRSGPRSDRVTSLVAVDDLPVETGWFWCEHVHQQAAWWSSAECSS